MAVKEWSSNFPADLDTTSNMETITEGDQGRPSQINAARDAVISLQNEVGSDNLEEGTLRKNVSNILGVLDGYASSFDELSDTPSSKSGQGGKFIAVNGGATALEYVDAPSGGGNTLDQAYDQGGAGSGRTINVTSGAVELVGDQAANVFEITMSSGAENMEGYGIYIDAATANNNLQGFVMDFDTGSTFTNTKAFVINASSTSFFQSGQQFPVMDIGLTPNASDNATWYGMRLKALASGGGSTTMNGIVLTGSGWDTAFSAASGDLELENGAIRLAELSSDPTNVANKGFLYTKDDTGTTELFYRDSGGTVRQLTPPASGGGNTLNGAYDQGGAGAGRVINVTDGAVRLEGDQAANILELIMDLGAESMTGKALLIDIQAQSSNVNAATINVDTGDFTNVYGLDINMSNTIGALSGGKERPAIDITITPNASDVGTWYALRAEALAAGGGSTVKHAISLEGSNWNVALSADSGDIRLENGAIRLSELGSDPTNVADKGFVYTKDVSGTTELFYRDSGGATKQITSNVYEEEFTASAGANSFLLAATPSANSNTLSGRNILGVYRDGVRSRYQGTATTATHYDQGTANDRIDVISQTGGEIFTVVYMI